ncbi:MAG TPA: L-lactate dehydrogenase [Patescibacteria group bacterium]|nr:L-lactate dehydrogenase [Patescibacteria group bacterium]
MLKRTVFVIGAGGMVGATAAHALAIKEIASDIALIDVAEDLVRGQAMDINHATAFTNGVRVRVADYSDIKEDDVIVITCGIPQKPGQPRLELLETNARIITDVVGKVMAQGKPVFIIMVANPVDILTQVALNVSGLPKERVFGTGTTLDSARLRVTLAHHLHVSQQVVQAYILGEHGDSSFPALTNVTIGGIPLAKFPGFEPSMIKTIDQDIRAAAYQIIEAKKSTYYGIGHVVAKLVEALAHDRSSIFPVCSLTEGEYGLDNVVIGLPSLVSSRGVQILDNYPLSTAEQKQLKHSAEVIRKAAAGIV